MDLACVPRALGLADEKGTLHQGHGLSRGQMHWYMMVKRNTITMPGRLRGIAQAKALCWPGPDNARSLDQKNLSTECCSTQVDGEIVTQINGKTIHNT